MIRQVKPPALFSVDLSNVPAASCSIIMASSPLLLRRQCLSQLGPSPLLLVLAIAPHPPASPARLIVFSFSFVLPQLSFISRSSSLLRCSTPPSFLSSPDSNEDNERIAPKIANNKHFSAPRKVSRPISPRCNFPRESYKFEEADVASLASHSCGDRVGALETTARL